MALTRRRLAREVVGVSRSPSTLRRARLCGAVDVGMIDSRRAVRSADLVVIATPVDTIVPYARRLAPCMRVGSILTDVGSTKGEIVRALERTLPAHVAFVGAHPIAGSERRGFGAADARLFDGSFCVLTPTARTPRAALRAVTQLWAPLVDRVITMSSHEHDRALAGMSHLPHLVAYCLAGSAKPHPLPRVPRSFLEMTRLAKSTPELWDDIFFSNRSELLAAMDRFEGRWRALRARLAHGDRAALRQLLRRAQSARDALHE